MTLRKHPLIVLEGADGVGKSTLRDGIYAELCRARRPAMMVTGHCWLDVAATRALIAFRDQRHALQAAEVSDARLTDRLTHAALIVAPALQSHTVIADRYIASDAVYQEVVFGIPALETLETYRARGIILPDVVVLVDAPAAIAVDRIVRRDQPRQFYENAKTLPTLIDRFRALLLEDPPSWFPPVIRIDNGSNDRSVSARDLLRELAPLVGYGTV